MSSDAPDSYVPDYRLDRVYEEANLIESSGLEQLCPSYSELSNSRSAYRDESPLGRGAIKEVSRIFDTRSKRWMAMARVRADRGPEFFDMLVHEAWLTSSLSHPNIINIYEVGIDEDGKPYFTMDLKEGTTLGDLIGVDGNPASETAEPTQIDLLAVFAKICDAVAYAHSRGVLHLDLKPSNIQVEAFGEVLVCDWGLGKLVGDGELPATGELAPAGQPDVDNMTLTGEIKGSPGFMAPEQLEPGGEKDQRTDVFALGCTLYAILTGASAFTGCDTAEVLRQTEQGEIEPPRQRFPHLHLSPGLEALVMKATSLDPADRYPSAGALRTDLERHLRGFATRAEGSGFLRDLMLLVRRNLAATGILITALVGITVLSVLFVQRLNQQQQVTAKERERASRLETRADTLASLYEGELVESERSRSELSGKLANSANSLKNLGIFERPAEAVREAHQLAAMASTLDPDNEAARFQRFALNCITLNFHEALAYPPEPDNRYADYLQFAEAFPHFEFGERERPTAAQLGEFFRVAYQRNPERGALMERILSYDVTVRRDWESFDLAFGDFLSYFNGGEKFACDYSPVEASMRLQSDSDVRLVLGKNRGGSSRSLLRFVPIRSLELEVLGKVSLSDLDHLPIERLDLSHCPQLELHSLISLPLLRQIHLSAGDVDPNLLRARIRSAQPFEIIVSPRS